MEEKKADLNNPLKGMQHIEFDSDIKNKNKAKKMISKNLNDNFNKMTT